MRALSECAQNAWLAMRILVARDVLRACETLTDMRKELNDTLTWKTFLLQAAKGLLAEGAGEGGAGTPCEQQAQTPSGSTVSVVSRAAVREWQFEVTHVMSGGEAKPRQRRVNLHYFNSGTGLKLRCDDVCCGRPALPVTDLGVLRAAGGAWCNQSVARHSLINTVTRCSPTAPASCVASERRRAA